MLTSVKSHRCPIIPEWSKAPQRMDMQKTQLKENIGGTRFVSYTGLFSSTEGNECFLVARKAGGSI